MMHKKILLADASVEDLDVLLSGLSSNTELRLIHSGENSLETLANCLNHPALDTLHVLGHGSPGEVILGSQKINLASLTKLKTLINSNNSATFNSANQTMTSQPTTEICLWSCQTGAGNEGREFINALADLTNSTIFASEQLVGNSSKGGNWNLNKMASPRRGVPFSQEALEQFDGVLVGLSTSQTSMQGITAIALGQSTVFNDDGTQTLSFVFTLSGSPYGNEDAVKSALANAMVIKVNSSTFAISGFSYAPTGSDNLFGLPTWLPVSGSAYTANFTLPQDVSVTGQVGLNLHTLFAAQSGYSLLPSTTYDSYVWADSVSITNIAGDGYINSTEATDGPIVISGTASIKGTAAQKTAAFINLSESYDGAPVFASVHADSNGNWSISLTHSEVQNLIGSGKLTEIFLKNGFSESLVANVAADNDNQFLAISVNPTTLDASSLGLSNPNSPTYDPATFTAFTNSGSASFTVDTVAPTATILSETSNNANTVSLARGGDVISVSFTDSDSVQSVTIAGHSVTARQDYTNHYSATYSVASSDSGVADVSVVSVDAAGNTGSTTIAGSVTIDNQSPSITSLSETSNNANTVSLAKGGDVISVNFTDTDNVSSVYVGSHTASVSHIGNSYTATYAVSTASGDGTPNVTVNAVDLAGNTSSATLAGAVTIDTIAPDTPLVNNISSHTISDQVAAPPPATGSVAATDFVINHNDLPSGNTITLTGSASGSADHVVITEQGGVGTISYTASVDHGTWSQVVDLSTASVGAGSFVTDGFRAQAYDLAGNHSGQSTRVGVHFDNVAPSIYGLVSESSSHTGNSTLAQAGDVITTSFQIAGNDTVDSVLIDGHSAPFTTSTHNTNSSNTYTASYTVAAHDGDTPHTAGITVNAHDMVGNTSSATLSSPTVLINTPAAPSITAFSEHSNNANFSTSFAKEGEIISVTFNSDNSVQNVSIGGHSATSLNHAGNSYSATYEVQPGDGGTANIHADVSVTVVDSFGATSSISHTGGVTIDTQAPTDVFAPHGPVAAESFGTHVGAHGTPYPDGYGGSLDVGSTVLLGDTIQAVFTASDVVDKVIIENQTISLPSDLVSDGAGHYTASYMITTDSTTDNPNGGVTIYQHDAAGHSLSDSADGPFRGLNIDTYLPTATIVSEGFAAGHHAGNGSTAVAGDIITLTLSSPDMVDSSIYIAGNQVELVQTHIGETGEQNLYTASYTVQADYFDSNGDWFINPYGQFFGAQQGDSDNATLYASEFAGNTANISLGGNISIDSNAGAVITTLPYPDVHKSGNWSTAVAGDVFNAHINIDGAAGGHIESVKIAGVDAAWTGDGYYGGGYNVSYNVAGNGSEHTNADITVVVSDNVNGVTNYFTTTVRSYFTIDTGKAASNITELFQGAHLGVNSSALLGDVITGGFDVNTYTDVVDSVSIGGHALSTSSYGIADTSFNGIHYSYSYTVDNAADYDANADVSVVTHDILGSTFGVDFGSNITIDTYTSAHNVNEDFGAVHQGRSQSVVTDDIITVGFDADATDSITATIAGNTFSVEQTSAGHYTGSYTVVGTETGTADLSIVTVDSLGNTFTTNAPSTINFAPSAAARIGREYVSNQGDFAANPDAVEGNTIRGTFTLSATTDTIESIKVGGNDATYTLSPYDDGSSTSYLYSYNVTGTESIINDIDVSIVTTDISGNTSSAHHTSHISIDTSIHPAYNISESVSHTQFADNSSAVAGDFITGSFSAHPGEDVDYVQVGLNTYSADSAGTDFYTYSAPVNSQDFSDAYVNSHGVNVTVVSHDAANNSISAVHTSAITVDITGAPVSPIVEVLTPQSPHHGFNSTALLGDVISGSFLVNSVDDVVDTVIVGGVALTSASFGTDGSAAGAEYTYSYVVDSTSSTYGDHPDFSVVSHDTSGNSFSVYASSGITIDTHSSAHNISEGFGTHHGQSSSVIAGDVITVSFDGNYGAPDTVSALVDGNSISVHQTYTGHYTGSYTVIGTETGTADVSVTTIDTLGNTFTVDATSSIIFAGNHAAYNISETINHTHFANTAAVAGDFITGSFDASAIDDVINSVTIGNRTASFDSVGSPGHYTYSYAVSALNGPPPPPHSRDNVAVSIVSTDSYGNTFGVSHTENVTIDTTAHPASAITEVVQHTQFSGNSSAVIGDHITGSFDVNPNHHLDLVKVGNHDISAQLVSGSTYTYSYLVDGSESNPQNVDVSVVTHNNAGNSVSNDYTAGIVIDADGHPATIFVEAVEHTHFAGNTAAVDGDFITGSFVVNGNDSVSVVSVAGNALDTSAYGFDHLSGGDSVYTYSYAVTGNEVYSASTNVDVSVVTVDANNNSFGVEAQNSIQIDIDGHPATVSVEDIQYSHYQNPQAVVGDHITGSFVVPGPSTLDAIYVDGVALTSASFGVTGTESAGYDYTYSYEVTGSEANTSNVDVSVVSHDYDNNSFSVVHTSAISIDPDSHLTTISADVVHHDPIGASNSSAVAGDHITGTILINGHEGIHNGGAIFLDGNSIYPTYVGDTDGNFVYTYSYEVSGSEGNTSNVNISVDTANDHGNWMSADYSSGITIDAVGGPATVSTEVDNTQFAGNTNAVVGDTITGYLDVRNSDDTVDAIYIDGRPVTAFGNNAATQWTYSYNVSGTESMGEYADISVVSHDLAGNSFSVHYTDSTISFDNNPAAVVTNIGLDNTGSFGQVGDVITVGFTANADETVDFVSIAGQSVTFTAIDATNYTASYTVAGGEDPTAHVSIVVQDTLGNSIGVDASSSISLDGHTTATNIEVGFGAPELGFNDGTIATAIQGDVITVGFDVTDEFLDSVSFGGHSATSISVTHNEVGSTSVDSYVYGYTVSGDEASGIADVSIQTHDTLGVYFNAQQHTDITIDNNQTPSVISESILGSTSSIASPGDVITVSFNANGEIVDSVSVGGWNAQIINSDISGNYTASYTVAGGENPTADVSIVSHDSYGNNFNVDASSEITFSNPYEVRVENLNYDISNTISGSNLIDGNVISAQDSQGNPDNSYDIVDLSNMPGNLGSVSAWTLGSNGTGGWSLTNTVASRVVIELDPSIAAVRLNDGYLAFGGSTGVDNVYANDLFGLPQNAVAYVNYSISGTQSIAVTPGEHNSSNIWLYNPTNDVSVTGAQHSDFGAVGSIDLVNFRTDQVTLMASDLVGNGTPDYQWGIGYVFHSDDNSIVITPNRNLDGQDFYGDNIDYPTSQSVEIHNVNLVHMQNGNLGVPGLNNDTNPYFDTGTVRIVGAGGYDNLDSVINKGHVYALSAADISATGGPDGAPGSMYLDTTHPITYSFGTVGVTAIIGDGVTAIPNGGTASITITLSQPYSHFSVGDLTLPGDGSTITDLTTSDGINYTGLYHAASSISSADLASLESSIQLDVAHQYGDASHLQINAITGEVIAPVATITDVSFDSVYLQEYESTTIHLTFSVPTANVSADLLNRIAEQSWGNWPGTISNLTTTDGGLTYSGTFTNGVYEQQNSDDFSSIAAYYRGINGGYQPAQLSFGGDIYQYQLIASDGFGASISTTFEVNTANALANQFDTVFIANSNTETAATVSADNLTLFAESGHAAISLDVLSSVRALYLESQQGFNLTVESYDGPYLWANDYSAPGSYFTLNAGQNTVSVHRDFATVDFNDYYLGPENLTNNINSISLNGDYDSVNLYNSGTNTVLSNVNNSNVAIYEGDVGNSQNTITFDSDYSSVYVNGYSSNKINLNGFENSAYVYAGDNTINATAQRGYIELTNYNNDSYNSVSLSSDYETVSVSGYSTWNDQYNTISSDGFNNQRIEISAGYNTVSMYENLYDSINLYGGTNSVDATVERSTVYINGGNNDVYQSEWGGTNNVTIDGGYNTIHLADNHDTISVTDGENNITVTAGVDGPHGYNSVSLSGGETSLDLESIRSTVTVTGGDNNITSSAWHNLVQVYDETTTDGVTASYNTITSDGWANTIDIEAGTNVITEVHGGSSISLSGDSANTLTLDDDSGNNAHRDTVSITGGSNSIASLGSDDDRITIDGGSNTFNLDYSYNNTFNISGGDNLITETNGNDGYQNVVTINDGSNNTINLRDSEDTISVSDGENYITISTGHDNDGPHGYNSVSLSGGETSLDLESIRSTVTVTGGDNNITSSAWHNLVQVYDETTTDGVTASYNTITSDGWANTIDIEAGTNVITEVHGGSSISLSGDSANTLTLDDDSGNAHRDTVSITGGSNSIASLGSYDDRITIDGGSNTFNLDYSYNNTFNISGGDNRITETNGNDGYQNVVTINGGSNNTIDLVDDSDTISVSDGQNFITLSTDVFASTENQGHNSVSLSGGTTSLEFDAFDSTVSITGGTNIVTDMDGVNTITVGGLDGGLNTITLADHDALTISAGTNFVTGGNSETITINGAAYDHVTLSGSGDLVTISGGGHNTITDIGGANTISVIGDSTNNISLADGESLELSVGANTVTGGSGELIVINGEYGNGGTNTVQLYGVAETVSISAGINDVTYNDNGNDYLDDYQNGYQGTLIQVTGSSTNNITVNEDESTVSISAGYNTVNLQEGDDEYLIVNNGNSHNTINLGVDEGNSTVTINDGANVITDHGGYNYINILGESSNTITLDLDSYDYGGNDTVTIAAGTNTLWDEAGNANISISAGNNTLSLNGGSDHVAVSGGNNSISDNAGYNTLTVSDPGGSNTFNLSSGDKLDISAGVNYVQGTGAWDTISITGNGTVSATDFITLSGTNDYVSIQAGSNSVVDKASFNTITVSDPGGSNTFSLNWYDELDIAAGTNYVTETNGNNSITITGNGTVSATDFITLAGGNDIVSIQAGNNKLVDLEGDNTISVTGLGGINTFSLNWNDELDISAGSNTVTAKSHDTISVTANANSSGVNSIDFITLAGNADLLSIHAGTNSITDIGYRRDWDYFNTITVDGMSSYNTINLSHYSVTTHDTVVIGGGHNTINDLINGAGAGGDSITINAGSVNQINLSAGDAMLNIYGGTNIITDHSNDSMNISGGVNTIETNHTATIQIYSGSATDNITVDGGHLTVYSAGNDAYESYTVTSGGTADIYAAANLTLDGNSHDYVTTAVSSTSHAAVLVHAADHNVDLSSAKGNFDVTDEMYSHNGTTSLVIKASDAGAYTGVNHLIGADNGNTTFWSGTGTDYITGHGTGNTLVFLSASNPTPPSIASFFVGQTPGSINLDDSNGNVVHATGIQTLGFTSDRVHVTYIALVGNGGYANIAEATHAHLGDSNPLIIYVADPDFVGNTDYPSISAASTYHTQGAPQEVYGTNEYIVLGGTGNTILNMQLVSPTSAAQTVEVYGSHAFSLTAKLNGVGDTIMDYTNVSGTAGNTINGGNGNDVLIDHHTGNNTSILNGGAGNDILAGGYHSTLNGGDGNDALLAIGGASLNGGAGNDLLVNDYLASSTLSATVQSVTMAGGSGNDTFAVVGDTSIHTGVSKTIITDLATGDTIDLGFLETTPTSNTDLVSGTVLTNALNGHVSYTGANTIVSLSGLGLSSAEGNANASGAIQNHNDAATDTNSTLLAPSTIQVNATITSKVSTAITNGIDTADTALHNTGLNITSHDLIANFPALNDVYHNV
ncbi:DUF4347 domain-containing protein [Polynucleobacter paneuropaeus]|nr:DUF4347 domain-containing protein [Polynucleobacter paneuropaeus]